MNITMTGRNIEVTVALREVMTTRLNRIMKHFKRITSVAITFDVEKVKQIVEATVHIPGHQIHASADHADMYSAIDLLIDKLDKQLTKHKEKDSHHS